MALRQKASCHSRDYVEYLSFRVTLCIHSALGNTFSYLLAQGWEVYLSGGMAVAELPLSAVHSECPGSRAESGSEPLASVILGCTCWFGHRAFSDKKRAVCMWGMDIGVDSHPCGCLLSSLSFSTLFFQTVSLMEAGALLG